MLRALNDWVNPLGYLFPGSEQKEVPVLEVKKTFLKGPGGSGGVQEDLLQDDEGDFGFDGWVTEDCPTTIHLVLQTARKHYSKQYLEWLDDNLRVVGKLTYGELADVTHSIAHELRSTLGLKKGDRVLLLFLPESGKEFIPTFFACLLAGVVPVPLYPPSPANFNQDMERMSKIAQASGAMHALTTSKLKHFLMAARMKLAFSHGFQSSWPAQIKWTPVDRISKRAPPNAKSIDDFLECIRPEDLAFLQFTSGSTGFPKGVMVGHSCLSHNIACLRRVVSYRQKTENMVFVGWLPLYHDFGLIIGVTLGACSGGLTIGQSPLTFLKRPLSWLEVLSRYNGTHTGAPNFALARCVKSWEALPEDERPKLDLSSVQTISLGGEPVQKSVMKDFTRVFSEHGLGSTAVQPCYGLAEHVVFLSSSKGVAAEDMVDENGTVVSGKMRFGIDIRIVDPQSHAECSDRSIGEIWVSSPSVCRGYWGLEEMSEKTFRAPLNGRKYLRTGDLGYLRNGLLYVTGRLKDVIIVGGSNYYPQDIEETVIETIPLARAGRVAAFSIEDDRVGIVVELREDKPSPEVCQDIFQKIVASVRIKHRLTVSRIKLIKARSIPRTTSGKIKRQESRKSLLEGRLTGIPSGDFDASASFASTGCVSNSASAIDDEESSISGEVEEMDVAESKSEQEKVINTICKVCVVPIDKLDRSMPLTNLGMTSIQVFRIISELEAEYPGLEAMHLMQPISVQELSRNIVQGHYKEADSEIPAVPIEDVMYGVPLSFGQEQMVILHQLMPNSCAYNVPVAIKLTGKLSVPALQQCFVEMIERHCILSVRFEERNGNLVQLLDESLRRALNNFSALDIRPMHGGRPETCAEIVYALFSAEISTPFDLFKGPVVRVQLLQSGDEEHLLLVNSHHSVVDGWSMRVLINDLCKMYSSLGSNSSSTMDPPKVQFLDYAAWQRKSFSRETLDELLQFWINNLAGAPKLLDLPTDKPRGQTWSTAPAGSVPVKIGRDLVKRLNSIATEQGTTLSTTLLSVFQILLGRYSGQEDIVVGLPFAGRPHSHLMSIVGYIANTVPLRVDLSGDPSYISFLQQTKDVCFAAFENSSVPLYEIVKAVSAGNKTSFAPIFQVLFNLHSVDLMYNGMQMGPCKVEPMVDYCKPQESRFDISLELLESNGEIGGTLEYSTDLFNQETMQRMAGHYLNLVEAIILSPDLSIGQLPMLSNLEKKSLRKMSIDRKYIYNIPEMTLHEMFHAAANKYPKKGCLLYRGKETTYQEIEAITNQLAHCLIAMGVGPDKNVGIITDKSDRMIIAILGILKAGGAYSPIDPSYPDCRMKNILEDADVQIVIVQSDIDAAQKLAGLNLSVMNLSETLQSGMLRRQPTHFPTNRSSASSLAYTIFTSGSTGRPKGVMIQHRAVTNFLQWMTCEFELSFQDRYLQNINYSFDLSMMEIFLSLTSGGLLILPDHKFHPDPSYVVDLINKTDATFCCSVPSILQAFVQMCQPGDCKTLRNQICCGEVLPTSLAAQFLEKLPSCTLANTYGPTEATIFVTSQVLNCNCLENPLSIGRPISNVAVYIVDENMEPCPPGVPGELMISGTCLAKGYANRPDLTADRFIKNPFATDRDSGDFDEMYRSGDVGSWNPDGSIKYIGRTDNQVKVRGFRIELGEVEVGISRLPSVFQAVAAVKPDPSGAPHLVAYVVPHSVDPEQLKEELKQFLPYYMVPTMLIPVKSFSSLPNGKTNRAILPDPVWSSHNDGEDCVPPRNGSEERLLRIWQEVLGKENIGVHSDFFKMGGDSMKAGLIAARIRLETGIQVPGILLFKYRTIAELAECAENEGIIGSQPDLLTDGGFGTSPSVVGYSARQLEDGVPVSLSQKRMLRLYECDKKNCAYNIPLVVRLEGYLDSKILKKVIELLVNRHTVLMMKFKKTGSTEWVSSKPEQYSIPKVKAMDLTYMGSEFETNAMELAMEIFTEDASRPFDLYNGPPLRINLLKLAEDDHALMFTFHHVAFDGVSIGIIAKEFLDSYNSLHRGVAPNNQECSLQYYDFAKWQRGLVESKSYAKQIEFWKNQLQGLPPVLKLPTDVDQNHRKEDGFGPCGHVDVFVSSTTVEKLRKVAQSDGSTLNMILAAAFDLVLSWIANRSDIVVGTPFAAGRLHKNTEEMIGYLVNPLPVRIDVNRHKTFEDLLSGVREVMIASFENGQVPLDTIVEAVGAKYSAANHPIYQVVMALNSGDMPDFNSGALKVTPVRVEETMKETSQPILMDLTESSVGLHGYISYNSSFFSEESVKGWVQSFLGVLKCAGETPQLSLDEFRHNFGRGILKL